MIYLALIWARQHHHNLPQLRRRHQYQLVVSIFSRADSISCLILAVGEQRHHHKPLNLHHNSIRIQWAADYLILWVVVHQLHHNRPV